MEATPKAETRTPRGQGELLRERLIDAALERLDEGLEPSEISIRGVTKHAGISPTAFYLHFDDRQQLMRALVERSFTDFRRRINEGAGQGGDPQQRLVGAGIAYMKFAREQPERYRLIFAADWTKEGIKQGPDDKVEVADAAFTDLVELIADRVGTQPPREELETLALGMWSGLHGYATLCHAEPGMAALTDEQYANMLADAWLGQPPGT